MSIALPLHVLAILIWVGGMFFAYMILRPAAGEALEPPARLKVWDKVFARFFPWVWAAIIITLITGYWMLLVPFGGFANAPVFIHIMNGLGLVMMAIFMHVFFAPYKRLSRAVSAEDWQTAGKQLAQIRILVGINLAIGLLTVVIATGGKFFL
ncbi:MAG: CopD family protein [bacterium]